MINFEHLSASTQVEALEMVGPDGSGSFIAGGTDLLVLMKEGITKPSRIVDIKAIDELRGITREGRGLRIGALTTLAEIAESAAVRQGYEVLAQAAQLAASPQLRNMATVGGNLLQRPRCWYFRGDYQCWLKGGDTCYAVAGENHQHAILDSGPCIAVHPGDIAPALVALDASVEIQGPLGDRILPAAAFFRDPTEDRRIEHELRGGELITAILLPEQPEGTRSTYEKAMARGAWAYALVSVAARVAVKDGVVSDTRIVLGSVATMPWRATEVERALLGQAPSEEAIANAVGLVLAGATPLKDNAYKLPLARNLVRRALTALA